MKPKHAAAERYRRAEEAYLQRVQSRVEEEEAGGTVFFAGPVETHPPELKLRDGRLTILRPETGDDCFDTQGFLLRRLETYRWDEKRLKLQGEFYYQSEEGLRYVEQVSSSVREHLPSMGLDVKLHRPTEIMCLNEAVVAEGRRLGVATPMLDTLAKMIRTIEANYDHLAF